MIVHTDTLLEMKHSFTGHRCDVFLHTEVDCSYFFFNLAFLNLGKRALYYFL